jgi:hypothetical protein
MEVDSDVCEADMLRCAFMDWMLVLMVRGTMNSLGYRHPGGKRRRLTRVLHRYGWCTTVADRFGLAASPIRPR